MRAFEAHEASYSFHWIGQLPQHPWEDEQVGARTIDGFPLIFVIFYSLVVLLLVILHYYCYLKVALIVILSCFRPLSIAILVKNGDFARFQLVGDRWTNGPTDGPTNGPTDGLSSGRTDTPSYRDVKTHLKTKEAKKFP